VNVIYLGAVRWQEHLEVSQLDGLGLGETVALVELGLKRILSWRTVVTLRVAVLVGHKRDRRVKLGRFGRGDREAQLD
jgi:hypothetical protein